MSIVSNKMPHEPGLAPINLSTRQVMAEDRETPLNGPHLREKAKACNLGEEQEQKPPKGRK